LASGERQNLTGDKRGALGQEEVHGSGDVIRRAEFP
jgi:hypothetical protein